jgi:hypothetical protein
LQPKTFSLLKQQRLLFHLLPSILLLVAAQVAAKRMEVVAVEVDSELRQIFH